MVNESHWSEAIVNAGLPSLVEVLKKSSLGREWKSLFKAGIASGVSDTRIAEATLNASAGGEYNDPDFPFRAVAALLKRVGDPDKTEEQRKFEVLEEKRRLGAIKTRYAAHAVSDVVKHVAEAEKLLGEIFPE